MKFQKKFILTFILTICISFILSSSSSAGEISLDLIRTTDYSRTNFDEAFIMVWAGDVKYLGNTIGDFTAVLTKTTHTGTNGSIIQYDLIIPGSGKIGDFISIRANHIVTGSGADHGLVYATSPAYKFLVGATFEKEGDKAKIKWSSVFFPTYSPLFKKDKKEK
ncbi:MAG: hypothetical protein ACFFDN_40015 [Candidatus Hodarchaeota archaeon]